ncbi:hypothetical protein N9985_03355 [Gammaproteobacteria bacterium]|nr:hypothetical protein [Gammaproteobacteria bacterium]
MFTGETDWQEVVEAAWEYSKVLDNLTEETDCPMLDFCRSLGHITAKEAFDLMAPHPAGGPWFLWCVTKGWHLLDKGLRKQVLKIVCDSMPVVASIMYVQKDDLDPEDYDDLWVFFSEQMPLMKQRIVEGKIKLKRKEAT